MALDGLREGPIFSSAFGEDGFTSPDLQIVAIPPESGIGTTWGESAEGIV
jgi:hypothetical protein